MHARTTAGKYNLRWWKQAMYTESSWFGHEKNAGFQVATSQNMTIWRKKWVLHFSLSPSPPPPYLFIQYTTAVRPHKKFAQIYMVKVGWESRISSAAKAWAFFYFFSSWKPMWHYGIKSAFQGGSCIISMYDAFLRCDDLEQSSYLYMVALYLLNSSSQFWIPRGRW